VLQFVYLKESFCPSLDEKIAVLYEVATHYLGCLNGTRGVHVYLLQSSLAEVLALLRVIKTYISCWDLELQNSLSCMHGLLLCMSWHPYKPCMTAI